MGVAGRCSLGVDRRMGRRRAHGGARDAPLEGRRFQVQVAPLVQLHGGSSALSPLTAERCGKRRRPRPGGLGAMCQADVCNVSSSAQRFPAQRTKMLPMAMRYCYTGC